MSGCITKRVAEVRKALEATGTAVRYGDLVTRFTPEFKVSRSTVERLIRKAREQIRLAKELEKECAWLASQPLHSVASPTELEAIIKAKLMEIIKGNARIKKVMGGDRTVLEVSPDFNDMIGAMVLYDKYRSGRKVGISAANFTSKFIFRNA